MTDWPVKVLIGEIGDLMMPRTPPFEERPVTEEDRRRALSYFAAVRARAAEWCQRTNDNDPDGPPPDTLPASVGEGGTQFAKGGGWVDMSGDGYLSNDVPAPIVVDAIRYPSVTHAYWSLSTDDPAPSSTSIPTSPAGCWPPAKPASGARTHSAGRTGRAALTAGTGWGGSWSWCVRSCA